MRVARLAAMFAWAVLAVLFGLAPAAAEKRVALVVGNGAYAHVARLANPRNDAELMAQTLRTLGFTLIGDGALVDLDKAGFDTAVQSFGAALHGADVGLFYYAGHGVQVRGANYLVPVGANPVKEADVDFQMLDANLVLRQMEGSGTKLNVVILDSCRNNPFGGRGLRTTGNGLVQMQAPEGTLISYATQPGNVAQDGSDDNSPYTKALAQTILRPGLGIFDAFNEVGLAVKKITGGSQQPWVSSSPIAGSFYFSGAPAASITGNVPQSADPAERAWAVIQNTTSVAILDDFIRQFGNTPYGSMARARLEELKKSQVAIVVPPVAPPTLVQPAVGVFPPGVYPLSPERDRTLKPKDIFKECDQCPEMVVVPSGSFSMGSPASEPQRSSDESPQHQITFARQFAVGKFAITFDEWDACVADGGCNEYRPDDRNWGRGRLPVINVNWNDAKAYVAWLSRKTGKSYRLLSEAEREYVTRAGTMTPFWWGSSISTSQANYDGNYAYNNGSKGEYRQRTMPANSFQANPWGLYQVHGNVWEWTEDCWNSSYTGAPTDGAAWTGGDCTRRVLRGGSRIHSPQDLRSAFRSGYFTDLREPYVGFRLGRTLLPP